MQDRHLQVDTKPDQLEQALQDSRAHLSSIIASAMDAIITIDDSQRILLFNSAAEQMFGYTSKKVMGQSIHMLLPERFRTRHQHHIHTFGTTGVTTRGMGRLGTLYGRRSNGEEFPIEASISQVTLARGKLYTVILRDISERVKAMEAIKETEQNLKATFEQAAVGIVHVSTNGRYLRFNQRFREILGYSPEELQDKSMADVTYPEDLDPELRLQKRLAQGEIDQYTFEKRYIRKDGSLNWVNLTVSLVRDTSGEPRYMIKVVEDITSRKDSEAALHSKTDELKIMTQQLWQTAKLATMGELAASIAHELNNPLAIVSLRVESLMSRVLESSPEQRELSVIATEVDRMGSLVGNLLQFSRSSDRNLSSLDIQDEIEKTLELIHTYLAHRGITVHRVISTDLPMVVADRQQIRQLFLNLFTNATDAMPGGGTLEINIHQVEEGKNIHITVSDTGVGIDPADVRRVLEPFFTTKKGSKGTGLGLPICKRIVVEHHGEFEITSAGLGEGATVSITLPTTSGKRRPVIME
jgi:PAS domain S-box-containing protein